MACTLSAKGPIGSFNDMDALRRLDLAVISDKGLLSSGQTLLSCDFITDIDPIVTDFGLTLVEANDLSVEIITVSLAVSNIQCEPSGGATGSPILFIP